MELLEVAERDNAGLAADNASLASEAVALAERAEAAEAALASTLAERDEALRERDGAVAERDGLASDVEALQERVGRLVERIAELNARLWSPSSERGPRLRDVAPGQLSLFNDIEAAAAGDSAEPEPGSGREGDGAKAKAKGRRRRGKAKPRNRIEDLEVAGDPVDHLPDELTCPECGGDLVPMGYDVVREVEYVPARLMVTEHRVWKYVCPECSRANAEDGGETRAVLVRAERPALVLPGTLATPSLLARAIGLKYEWGMPVNRVWRQLDEIGLPVARNTLCGWVISAWQTRLSALEARVWERVRGGPVLQVDETTVQVLKEPDRRPSSLSYMWVAVSGELAGPDDPVGAHFEYHPTRKHEIARKLLEGCDCGCVTDGYGAYDDPVPGVRNSRCLTHIRRPFAAIVKSVGADAARAAGSLALEATERIAAIYAIENTLRDLAPDERAEARRLRVLPLMTSLYWWCVQSRAQAAPGSALARALAYAVENIDRMGPYLFDGRVPVDNNHAERTIRPFAVGRKAWLFSDTVAGAEASAGLYSIVLSARMNGLSGTRYVKWALTELTAATPSDDEGWERLMPWSDEARAACAPRPGDEEPPDPAEAILEVDPETLNPG